MGLWVCCCFSLLSFSEVCECVLVTAPAALETVLLVPCGWVFGRQRFGLTLVPHLATCSYYHFIYSGFIIYSVPGGSGWWSSFLVSWFLCGVMNVSQTWHRSAVKRQARGRAVQWHGGTASGCVRKAVQMGFVSLKSISVSEFCSNTQFAGSGLWATEGF